MPVTIVSAKMGRAGKKGRAAMRIQRVVRKRGLNKTEKKQTKQIVERAIKQEHTLKYFDVDRTFTAAAPAVSTNVNTLKQISVLGYSSTTNENNAGVVQKYGQQDIIPLYLARPFKQNGPDAELTPNALNGQYCLPKMARVQFSMERVYMMSSLTNTYTTPHAEAAETLPMHYRIIQVEIKAQQGTQEVVNPNRDLFLDVHNAPTGIDEPNFDRLTCKYAKINNKKYTSKMDVQGTISQNNCFNPTFSTTSYNSPWTESTTQKSGPSEKHLNVNFQLSARKNGKLFYEEPQQTSAVQTFSSGGKRQLLLIHTWFGNGHLLLGGNVGGVDQPTAPTSDTIQIKHRASAAFIDVQ